MNIYLVKAKIRAHWQSFAMAIFFGLLFVVQLSWYGVYPLLHLTLICSHNNCTIDSRTFWMWFDLGLFLVMATAFVTFVVTEWQMSKEREKKSKEFWR